MRTNGAEQVATAWVAQATAGLVRGNVSFDGPAFKSYSKIIAYRFPHFVLMTCYYHSRTSSRHRGEALAALRKAGLRVLMVPYADVDGLASRQDNNHKYNHQYLIDRLKDAEQRATRFSEEESFQQQFKQAEADLNDYEVRFGLKELA